MTYQHITFRKTEHLERFSNPPAVILADRMSTGSSETFLNQFLPKRLSRIMPVRIRRLVLPLGKFRMEETLEATVGGTNDKSFGYLIVLQTNFRAARV